MTDDIGTVPSDPLDPDQAATVAAMLATMPDGPDLAAMLGVTT